MQAVSETGMIVLGVLQAFIGFVQALTLHIIGDIRQRVSRLEDLEMGKKK